ncbi:Protein CBG16392 [Caenorhabditis briggsae]|uniref:Mitochondrial 2-oxodicarboxylate carrier n=1 Tax=Caenorhabditis briggsae TaxID=6238 RepID=A8XNJ4_CAEBR|nr:Protein CBG16392 [Caenorhabditis briggsae]CAP34083.2 Protein CBG16392 [Caenorhabditis briggsae]
MSVTDKLKEGGRQITAGGSAGLVEVCLMYPLDVIKTRLQLGQQDKGMMDCVVKTLKNEGIGGFYKGILPPILAETPKRATKFFTFEQYKIAFTHSEIPMPVTMSFAGLFSGLTEAIVICPFEVVKVRLQADRKSSVKEQRSTAAMAREIYKTEGFGTSGLYRGLGATLGRHGAWNMVYFGLYHSCKEIIPDAKQNPSANLIGRIALGFTAGSLHLFSTFHSTWPKVEFKDHNLIRCRESIAELCKPFHWCTRKKGLLPKVMRLGPGGAVMLIVYDEVYAWLKKNT